MSSPRKGMVVVEDHYTFGSHYYYNYGNPWTNYYFDDAGEFVKIRPDAKSGDFQTPLAHAVLKQDLLGHYKYDEEGDYETHVSRGLHPEYSWALKTPWSGLALNVPESGTETAGSYINIDGYGVDVASDRMYSQIASSDYSIGTELAELTQSVNWLVQRTSEAAYALRDIKRGKFSKVFRRFFSDERNRKKFGLKDMNRRRWVKLNPDQRWLEAQFAVKPLLSSVDDAARLAAMGLEEAEPYITYKGSFKQSRPHEQYLTGFVNGDMTYRGNIDVHHRVKARFTISDPSLVALKNLGLINPVHALWNRVPFSFVVDWMLPIGKALSLMTALVGQTLSWCYESVKVSHDAGYTVIKKNWNGTKVWKWTADSLFIGYSRRIRTSIPHWRPSVKSPFSWWHAASAGALVTSLRSRNTPHAVIN